MTDEKKEVVHKKGNIYRVMEPFRVAHTGHNKEYESGALVDLNHMSEKWVNILIDKGIYEFVRFDENAVDKIYAEERPPEVDETPQPAKQPVAKKRGK